jgi:hypothetical protein
MNKMVLVLDDMMRPFDSSPLFGSNDIEDQYSGDNDFRLCFFRRRVDFPDTLYVSWLSRVFHNPGTLPAGSLRASVTKNA